MNDIMAVYKLILQMVSFLLPQVAITPLDRSARLHVKHRHVNFVGPLLIEVKQR